MKTAVIYARYSSDSQTEQSIEGQLRVCRDYAKQNDILIVDEYIDRATTGTNDNRAAFQQMLFDSNKKQWTIVLVYKLDRFARNKFEAVMNRKKLSDNGVELVSAMERIPDGPEGKLMAGLLEEINQYFSLELAQKVNRGLRESWLKGYVTGGHGLYGYDIIDKKFVINPTEAAVVQEIFTMYSQGYKARDIANVMKERGVKRKDGSAMDYKYIYPMVHNQRYTGIEIHQGVVYDNIVPRIISDELWRIVKEVNEKNKKSPSSKKAIYNYILTGKLVCGNCHKLMSGESGTSHTKEMHYYYVCLSRRRKKNHCELKPLKKQWLEDVVINATMAMLKKEGCIRMIAETLSEIHRKDTLDNTTLKALQKQLAETQKASANMIKAIEMGIITEQTKTHLCELEEKESQIKFEIEKEKQRTFSYLSADDLTAFLESQIFDNADDIEIRKVIVNQFIREIIVKDDEIIITYYFSDSVDTTKITPEGTKEIEEQRKSAIFSSKGSSNFLPGAVCQCFATAIVIMLSLVCRRAERPCYDGCAIRRCFRLCRLLSLQSLC